MSGISEGSLRVGSSDFRSCPGQTKTHPREAEVRSLCELEFILCYHLPPSLLSETHLSQDRLFSFPLEFCTFVSSSLTDSVPLGK